MRSSPKKRPPRLPRPSPELEARAGRAVESLFAQFGQHPAVSQIDFGYRMVQGQPQPDFALRIHVRRREWEGVAPEQLGFPTEVDGLPVVLMYGDYAAGS